MCGICIGGLCIPYGAILPMLLFGLQWIVQQLSKAGISLPKFITNRLTTGDKESNSSEDYQHQTTQKDKNNTCTDFWCLCKKRFARKSSVEGDSSVAATETSFSSLSDDDDEKSESDGGEEIIMIHSDQRQEGENNVNRYVRRRRRRNKMTTSTTKVNFIDGEWCMPCQ